MILIIIFGFLLFLGLSIMRAGAWADEQAERMRRESEKDNDGTTGY